MTAPSSRRNFLRGRFSARQGPLRPPWALAENDFLHACTRCRDCVRACRSKVVNERDSGYPTIDFTTGECRFCGACAKACKTGALKQAAGLPPWHARAAIDEQCLAQRRIECRICADQCEVRAIRFLLKAGGIATPSIDRASCTGCGACVASCPAGAVSVKFLGHKPVRCARGVKKMPLGLSAGSSLTFS